MPEDTQTTEQNTAPAPQPGVIAAPPSPTDLAAQSERTSDADAAMDAVFDQLAGTDDSGGQDESTATEGDTPSDGPVRDEKGRFAKKETPAEEAAEADTSEPDKKLPEDVDAESYKTAVKALQRDGVPDDVLEKQTPEQIVQWGLSAKKRQDDVDDYGKQIADLKAKQMETVDESPEADAVPAEPDIDWSETVEPINKQIQELFGDDTDLSEPLTAFGKQIFQQATEQTNQQVTALQNQLNGLMGQMVEKECLAVRDQLKERFPQLTDDKRYDSVLDTMAALNTKGTYKGMNDLMSAACRTEFAEELIAAHNAERKAELAKRANGTPSDDHMPSAPADSEREQDWDDQYLDAALSGNHAQMERLAKQAQTVKMPDLIRGRVK